MSNARATGSPRVRLLHATAGHPGAIAIFQLHGECVPLLRDLTGVNDWPPHCARLVQFGDIDQGIAARLSESITQLMPHGGPRVAQRLTARLLKLGAELVSPSIDRDGLQARDLYPEARDAIEAAMLDAIARAQSPAAIELLLDQPRRWREFIRDERRITDEDRRRSTRLNRLIDPPIVVLAGRPNVGKSTLSNALLGRTMSIALDMPGTTRDYTCGRLDLGGLVVDWHDTPGLRPTEDPAELRAMMIARGLLDRADLLIAMTDAECPQSWPDLPRQPDLRVINKIDVAGASWIGCSQEVIDISARTGHGVAALVKAIRDRLTPEAEMDHPGVWIFDERLGHPRSNA